VLPRYSKWKTTAFQATDAFFSSQLLLTVLFGMPSSIERLELTNSGSFAMILSALLLAQLFNMRFHAGLYQRHRARTLLALRVLVPVFLLGSWLSSTRRRDLLMHIIVIIRLLICVLLSLDWQLRTRLGAVLQCLRGCLVVGLTRCARHVI